VSTNAGLGSRRQFVRDVPRNSYNRYQSVA
jgi:hypothetical protein